MADVEYNSPGVFGVEVAPTRAQEGISPAKMGIIGWTERGPVNTPVEVRSVEEFSSYFGAINQSGLTAISMRAFFGTGGQRAWVVRVVPADATSATVNIDAPAKWTFTANGAGTWGNDLIIQVEGNRNFLDRTAGAEAYTKFDLKVLQPTAFNPAILAAAETYEAIQFVDPLASDYILAAMTDPRSPSLLVDVTAGIGGVPAGLARTTVTDLVAGTGDALGTTQFLGTLAPQPILDNTLTFVAADATVSNEDQYTGAASGPNTLFTNPGVSATHNLASTPITTALPLIPGTVTLLIDVGAGPVANTDDGAGAFAVSAQLPAGGTVNYNTGALTGATGSLLAGSSVTESHTSALTNVAINSVATGFTFTLPTTPLLDGSLRLFFAKAPAVLNEAPTTATPDGAVVDYAIAAGALSDSVHKENSVFRIKFPALDAASAVAANQGTTDGSGDIDLQANPIPVTAVGQPVHPGTVSIAFVPSGTIVDNGDGTVSGSGFAGPTTTLTGFIDYDSGEMFTDVAFTTPLVVTGATYGTTATQDVTASFDVSNFVVKAASTNNLATGVALTAAGSFGQVLDGAGTYGNTIDFVDNVTTPTTNGPILISVAVGSEPDTWGPGVVLVDFVASGIVNSDVAGNLTGDVGTGDNTVDFTSGDVDVEFSVAPLIGQVIDASYQTGQVAMDDGLGNLVGDVDAAGNNTIDYTTGEYDITWAAAPLDGSSVLANYVSVPRLVQFQLAGGTNGTAVTRTDISSPTLEDAREGIYAFDDVEDPLNLVVPDFEGSLFVQADIVDYCEARNTRFAILGFANGTTKDEAIKYVLVDQAFDTKVAAIYWPNVYFVNEVSQRPELIPVTPFIAGVYSKTAFNKNVGKSPGGIEDGALDANGTVGPEFGKLINDIRVRDDLYQSRINPLYNSDATGFVVWGVRSLSTQFRWRYINARLLHNFLMDSINRQLQWAVFENNGPSLWIKIETALKGYLGSLYRQGYFAGVTESQGYFVVCNGANNNQTTVGAGKAIIDIGFSPQFPAEFVIFRMSQPASTITV